MATELVDWVVRVQVTPAQKKALKHLAMMRDEEIRGLITWALHTSPLTRKVMKEADGLL